MPSRYARLALAAFVTLLPVAAFAQGTAKPPVTAGWADGFVIQSDGGDFRLQLGLLLHPDGRFMIDGDDDAVVNTFVIRLLRPSLRGRLADRFELLPMRPGRGHFTVTCSTTWSPECSAWFV